MGNTTTMVTVSCTEVGDTTLEGSISDTPMLPEAICAARLRASLMY